MTIEGLGWNGRFRGDGISLIGYRASGKSTIGPLLADRLARDFVDLDSVIEARAEKSIREIFETDGESRFRQWENDVLLQVRSERPSGVLATGGGAILQACIRDSLREHGLVVWLTASPGTLAERLRREPGDRPSLTSKGLVDEVSEVLRNREPLYRSVADLLVAVDELTPIQVVERVVSAYEDLSNRGGLA